MCMTCGCDSGEHHHDNEHEHPHHGTGEGHHHDSHNEDGHHHHHDDHDVKKIAIETDILAKNNRLAAENRSLLQRHGIFALNLVSSPGSGKTTLLERTLKDLKGVVRCAVIEGDQQTGNDAARIAATGFPAVQINTGAGCHLDAHMVGHALERFDLDSLDLLFIENVGNLVCPASFDLGENHKVVVLSVTEGEDKPLKYPHMFRAADVMLLNKTDLLPYVEFDQDKCREMARRINPDITYFELSGRTGAGMEAWYAWLAGKAEASK
jgi:hydrogenase nickel incorporation protein HypB